MATDQIIIKPCEVTADLRVKFKPPSLDSITTNHCGLPTILEQTRPEDWHIGFWVNKCQKEGCYFVIPKPVIEQTNCPKDDGCGNTCGQPITLFQVYDDAKGTIGNWFQKCTQSHFYWVNITPSEQRALNDGTKLKLPISETDNSRSQSQFNTPTTTRVSNFFPPKPLQMPDFSNYDHKGKKRPVSLDDDMEIDPTTESNVQHLCTTFESYNKTVQKLIDHSAYFPDRRQFYDEMYHNQTSLFRQIIDIAQPKEVVDTSSQQNTSVKKLKTGTRSSIRLRQKK